MSVLIDKGFEFASDFLSYLREGDERNERIQMASLERQKEFDTKLLSSIEDISHKLDFVAHDVATKVSRKLEADQLEKLTSQIKAIKFALEFNDKDMLRLTLVRIIDQLEYAKNRISEGKFEWLSPWMMAESIRIVSLRKIAIDNNALDVVYKEALAFRISILNFTGSFVVKTNNSPWLKISEFVEGKNEDILKLINSAKHLHNSDRKLFNAVLDFPDIDNEFRIVDVMVAVGDRVKTGDVLVALESDKSALEYLAKESGIVETIRVTTGDVVKNGTVLLILSEG